MKDITLAAQRARGHIQNSNKSIDAVIGAARVVCAALVFGLFFWTCLLEWAGLWVELTGWGGVG